jgi:tRNA (cmo5U34)-methyltransferase
VTSDQPKKLSVDQIRARFDAEVERFSNLETGQAATVDAPLVLDLVTRAAAAVTPRAVDLLDVGCGAGNYTLKLLQLLPSLNVTLVDLSRPMLDRAVSRVSPQTTGTVVTQQTDVRELAAGAQRFDIVIAAAVLHHLRTDAEWEAVFAKVYRALRRGGGFWIADLISHTHEPIQDLMGTRYAQYLDALGGESYRKDVLRYVEAEDTPRPLTFQLDLLRRVGFDSCEILHKNSCFAAFGAVKS